MRSKVYLEYPNTELGLRTEVFVARDILTFSKRLYVAVQNTLYQIAFQHPFFRSLLKCLYYLNEPNWNSSSAIQKLSVLSTLKKITDYDAIIHRLFSEELVMEDLIKAHSNLLEGTSLYA